MSTNETKDPTGRITQAELARRLKVSRPSVHKAIKTGRIKPDEDGLFDPIEAELAWVANTRQSAQGKRKAAAGGYAEHRARKEAALARMAELRLAQAERELAPRAEFDFVLEDLAATLRGLVENLADQLAPRVFQKPSIAEIHAIISTAGDELLFELSAAMERRARELDAGEVPAA